MTRAVSEHRPPASPLEILYQHIGPELAGVEHLLRSQLRSRHPFVDELVRYGCLLGGKRLRPALLLLSAKAVGGVQSSHLTLAVVVEMIHTATLVHDDVLDEASTRRHLATVNSRWDNESSILLGDFLFTQAFHLASTLDDVFACREIGNATNLVCEGELRQKGSRGDYGLSEAEYLSIIEAKTAELCACSCLLGARYAGASVAAQQQLAAYGRNLGIAFQIADDILDVVGHEPTTGKSLGTDLDQQKPTLPLIRALQRIEGSERAELLRSLEAEPQARRALLTPYLERSDAIQYARDKALTYARKARQQLDQLAASSAVHSLRQLADFVVARSA